MCGIAGIVDFTGRPIEVSAVQGMSRALEHRGPDDGDFFYQTTDRLAIGLAHRRLAIVDLSPAGRQPMYNEDGSLVLVANGEIYNFQALREAIGARHAFRSHSDSEVLLHLYEEEETGAFCRVDGMLAAALWDGRRERLLLVRDPLGKKPLYYWHREGRLAFASELRALLTLADGPRQVATERLGEYLTLGFVRTPHSLVRGIRRLPPGSYLVFERDHPPLIQRYWEIPPVAEISTPMRDAAAELLSRLREAVRKRLMADVPVGVFLSGGLDSSVVAALMSRETNSLIKTFAVGFAEDGVESDLSHARRVASALGSEHHEVHVPPADAARLDAILSTYGEPFADSTALAVEVLAREAREHCPVVLTGDGGDEIFGGYRRFAVSLSRPPWGGIQRLSRLLGSTVPAGRLQRSIRRLGRTPIERYLAQSAVIDVDFVTSLLRPEVPWESETLAAEYRARVDARTDLRGLRGLLALNIETYLLDDLLLKTDLMTMAHGVEARCPYLDRDVFPFAWNLPDDLKVNASEDKRVLREVARQLLPGSVANRPKQGFSAPVASWLRGPWRPLAEAAFSEQSRLGDFVDLKVVRLMWDRHLAGADWAAALWSLLVLERWLQHVR
jgi:asparagine synthase (glutamine-hydrolysing)